MKSDYDALESRIAEDLIDIELVVSRTLSAMEKAKKTNDDAYLDSVALNLHGFYSGVERIFEDISRTVDKSTPGGPAWHKTLLTQRSAQLNNVRPPVISRETRYSLEDYMGFRHVVRNVYTFKLKSSRLTELTEQLTSCFQSVKQDLGRFMDFLESMA